MWNSSFSFYLVILLQYWILVIHPLLRDPYTWFGMKIIYLSLMRLSYLLFGSLLLIVGNCSQSMSDDNINWSELYGTWNMVQTMSLTRNTEVPSTVESFTFRKDSTFEALSSWTGNSEGNWTVVDGRLLLVQFGSPTQIELIKLTADDLIWEMNIGGENLRCYLKR